MNVSLTPELEQFIAAKVASGLYQTSSEVVREALRALRDKEIREAKLEELRRELDMGVADADAGRTVPLTRELIENIKAEGRKRNAKKQRHG